MKKITFDDIGNPTPYEIVELDISECEKIFVNPFKTSLTRNVNWKSFRVYLNDLQNYLTTPLTQWIAGSFTTNKENPSDVDLVNLIDCVDDKKDLRQFHMDNRNNYPKKIYNIDGYSIFLYPESHYLYSKMIEQKEYWTKTFGSDYDDNPKALVEIKHEIC